MEGTVPLLFRAVNVISWGSGDAADKATLVSSNCCLQGSYVVPVDSVNVFSSDPRLSEDDNGNRVPVAAGGISDPHRSGRHGEAETRGAFVIRVRRHGLQIPNSSHR